MKKLLFLLMITILVIGTSSCKAKVSNTQTKVHETDESVSIVVSGNILLGAYKNGQWINSEKSEKLVTGKEKFTFFSVNKVLGSGLNTKIENFENGNAVKIERDFNTTYNNDSFYKYFIGDIGISGGWNALPRLPELQNTKSAACEDVVKGILAKKGLEKNEIAIKRITRVDLDGDGTEEEVITATDYELEPKTSDVAVGSYSVVILRKIVNGSVENIVVREQYRKEKPEYEYVFDCPLILDIDKDGIMELVIETRFGAWSRIEFCKAAGSKVNIIYTTEFGA